MALPIAVGMVVQTLQYLVDVYFVSRMGGVALAGVSAAGSLMFLVLALTQTLSVGTVAVISHAVGAKDQPRARLVFHQAVLLAAVLSAATLLGGYLGLADVYVGAVAADAETVRAGTTYLYWLFPAMALYFPITAMAATLQGTGIVKPTMAVQLLAVLINVVLTPVLVAGWGTGHAMGVAGAGLSTSLAAAAALALMAFYFARFERYVRFDFGELRPRAAVLRRMLGIGMPAGGEFALMFIYMAVIYTVIAGFGASAQAGFGVGVRVMQAVFLPALAIAFATPAIAGQNFGAGEVDRVRATFRTAATMIVVFMSLLTALCQWRADLLVRRFSGSAEVLAVAVGFMSLISWNFVANGLAITCSGMFQALGNTLPGLFANTTRVVTFALPAFWLARRPGFRIEHVWYLSVATVAVQAVISLLLLRWQLERRLRKAPGSP
jgi:putative MATE family efflux protein